MKIRCSSAALRGFIVASALLNLMPPGRAADDQPADKAGSATLPLAEVILYSSGVGYFQRDGQVTGKATVELHFKVDEINDLLKSMVVQDLDGGQVSTVTYGSRDPMTRTLKSFGLDLTSNPTLGQLLDQVRGEQVEVLHPNPLRGRVVGVERKTESLDDKRTIEAEHLNLLTGEGLQSVPLSQVQTIKLLDERLNGELQQALQVLATGHDTQKKSVTVRFEGEGKRKVSVAYIAQTPVWKTSYRLVLDEQQRPYLQGWAIVENTSDEDWKDVRLALVSGRPISFVMDLYQPLYTTRPVVQPELYTSLRPQVYGGAMEQAVELARDEIKAMPAPSAAPAAAMAGRSMSLARGAMVRTDKDAETRNLFSFQTVNAAAQGAEAGELFQYAIKTPVSLARQKSAMLPIVSETVEGQKVSIYNEGVQAKYPLNGFRLKNTTPLHLMQGPITVFDAGAYAGDARMEDLAAGQERLISYALDIKTEVEPQVKDEPQSLVSVRIRKGTLVARQQLNQEKTYLVRNRDQKTKTVLIEHPFRSDWELVVPKEAAERTRDVYRFKIEVEPEKSARLAVREQKQLNETVELVNTSPDVIAFYLKAKQVSAKVKEALQKVVGLRDRLDTAVAERGRLEQRVKEITQEQSRIRENMARLGQTSELYNRYVKKLDQQETELETLRRQIETLKDTETTRRRELNDYLLTLDVQ